MKLNENILKTIKMSTNNFNDNFTYYGEDEPDIVWLQTNYNVDIDKGDHYTWISGSKKFLDKFLEDHLVPQDTYSYVFAPGKFEYEESCNKKLNLTEGYYGETLEDFFDFCVEPSIISKFYIANIHDDDYNPEELDDYDDVIDKYGDSEFIEFDCCGKGIIVNIDTTEETGGYIYSTLEDFLEDVNEDEIRIFDFATEEEVFNGDKDDIPEELLEAVFVSFDAPDQIAITYEGEEPEEDEDDIDESLNENTLNEFKYDLTDDQIAKAKTIKVTRGEQRGYMCGTDYYYKDHLIEREDSNFGGALQWYCDDLLPNQSFDSLIELKYAIYKKEHKNESLDKNRKKKKANIEIFDKDIKEAKDNSTLSIKVGNISNIANLNTKEKRLNAIEKLVKKYIKEQKKNIKEYKIYSANYDTDEIILKNLTP